MESADRCGKCDCALRASFPLEILPGQEDVVHGIEEVDEEGVVLR